MHRAASPISFVILLAVATAAVAQVQPGNTGGSIGLRNKSVSGAQANPSAEKVGAQTRSGEASKNSSCQGAVGAWNWYLGLTVMTLNKDGTSRHSGGVTGRWTCGGKTINAVYTNGTKERYTLSKDGKSLHVNSSWNGGVSFTATRQE